MHTKIATQEVKISHYRTLFNIRWHSAAVGSLWI